MENHEKTIFGSSNCRDHYQRKDILLSYNFKKIKSIKYLNRYYVKMTTVPLKVICWKYVAFIN